MSRTDAILPPDDDPDRTDRLPVLDDQMIAVLRAEEMLETTGTWSRAEVVPAGGLAELQGELERRDAAIAELTSMLREKTFALARTERELEQTRSEVMRARQAASRELGELERRLQEVERERLDLAASHDEQRTALATIEDQLSAAREAEQQLEERLAARAAGEEALDSADARIAGLEAQLAQATRETLSRAQEQEHQSLRERVAELKNALSVAREERDVAAGERDELQQALRRRDADVESLLERLRSREARRRYAADLRREAGPVGAEGPDLRVAGLQQALASERAARRALEHELARLTSEEPAHDADEPTVAEEDRESLLNRLGALTSELARRDDRIANLESDLRAQTEAIVTARHGLGMVTPEPGAAPRPPAARCYLTRLDGESGVAHVLSAPRTAIGRTPDNDLKLEEGYISRNHAVIRLGPESAVIEDAGSRNGVFVNDRRVRRELLQDGDIVMLGKARFRFHMTQLEEA